jgi:hypothetical protein
MVGGCTVAVYVEAQDVDLRRGDHVENSDSDGAVALPQPGDSVRHGLEAGLPRALDAERNLVAAGVSRGSRAAREARGDAHGINPDCPLDRAVVHGVVCRATGVELHVNPILQRSVTLRLSQVRQCRWRLPGRKARWYEAKGG